MTSKENFTSEEWTKLLESTMLTGMAVSAADPSGLWGTIKEALASRTALSISKLEAGSSDLVQAVVADFQSKEGRTVIQEALRKHVAGAEPAEIVRRALDNLREVSAILEAKAPAEAPAFKACLCGIGQKVAEASLEGGFLGFGGVRVSEAEKATLADIAKALGTTA